MGFRSHLVCFDIDKGRDTEIVFYHFLLQIVRQARLKMNGS